MSEPSGLKAFTLGTGAAHHEQLRPFIGKTGMVVSEEHGGAILQVMFPDAKRLIPVVRTLGEVSRRRRIALGEGRDAVAPDDYAGPARRYEIELPLPPRNLSPNAHPAHLARAQAARNFRSACGRLITEAAIPPLRLPVRLALDFYLQRRQSPIARWGGVYDPTDFYYPTDRDNARASCKAAQDALMDAGVIAADDARSVILGDTTIRLSLAEHSGRTCLVLTIAEDLRES